MMDEPICPITHEVCRTHWCHSSFDCAEFHINQKWDRPMNPRPIGSLDALDIVAMNVIEGYTPDA